MAILELQQQSSSQNENTGRDLLSNSCIALFVTLRTQCALQSQLSSKEIYNTRVNQAMFLLTTINQWLQKKWKGSDASGTYKIISSGNVPAWREKILQKDMNFLAKTMNTVTSMGNQNECAISLDHLKSKKQSQQLVLQLFENRL